MEYVHKINMHVRELYHGMMGRQRPWTSTRARAPKPSTASSACPSWKAAVTLSVAANSVAHVKVWLVEDAEPAAYNVKAGKNWNVLHDEHGGLTVPRMVDVKAGGEFYIRVLTTAQDFPWEIVKGDSVMVATPRQY